MKSVLISVKPKFCELIASGKKTVELRKTRPKLDVPFKVYMYCTKDKIQETHGKYLHTSDKVGVLRGWDNPNDCDITVQPDNYTYKAYSCHSKVIGEFLCDDIGTYEIEYPSRFENVFRAIYRYIKDEDGEEYSFIEASNDMIDDELSNSYLLSKSCLTLDEIGEYVCGKKNNFNNFYAWHISDLVIYDKPKELSEFYKEDFDEIYSKWEDLFSIGVPTATDFVVKYPPEPKKEDYVIKRPPQSWCYVEEV